MKPDGYYSNVRDDVLSLIPAGAQRLLDVGCGAGATAAKAKTLGVSEVWGIEFDQSAAESARGRLDRVILGDIEVVEIDCPPKYFDCILCADVLEHTRNPWVVLQRLMPLLRDDGAIVVSLPNLQHLSCVLKIVMDRFEYASDGILDKTHLRFFTLHTMRKLFSDTGYQIHAVIENRSQRWQFKLANMLSFGVTTPFSVFQYLFVLKKGRA